MFLEDTDEFREEMKGKGGKESKYEAQLTNLSS